MSVHHLTEADVAARALDHPCPDCGAKAGKRCGWWQEPVQNPGYPQRRRWHHRPGLVHEERVQLAWRETVRALDREERQ
jgi:hypothetical protein